MLKKQFIIGNYTSKKPHPEDRFKVAPHHRERMIVLMQELHRLKKYRIETIHFATGIADSYLALLKAKDAPAPHLVHLAAVSILLAAKLNQPLSPSFKQMILLLNDEQRNDPNIKTKLIDLEFVVV